MSISEVSSVRGSGFRLWYKETKKAGKETVEREISHREFAYRMFLSALNHGSLRARWNRLRWAHFAYSHRPFTALAWSKWWMI